MVLYIKYYIFAGIVNQFDNDHIIDSLQEYRTDSVLDENLIENTPATEESEAYMMESLEVLEDILRTYEM